MEPLTIVGSTRTWARDFAIVGATTGSLAPFFVIFDPMFAVAAGFTGAATGAALGAFMASGLERFRNRVPLTVLAAGATFLGALWGAASGSAGGAFSSIAGSQFEGSAIALGFMFGGIAGMLQLGGMFLPYLLSAVHRQTVPVVLLGVMAAPFMGWAALITLFSAFFGVWLVAVPLVIVGGVALETSIHQARQLQAA